MLKKTGIYMTYVAACMLTLSACSADDVPSIADNQSVEEKQEVSKTPIELTVGIVGQSPSATTRGGSDADTRVVTLDNNNNNKAQAFEKGTSLYMVIKSENSSNTDLKYARTIGYAQDQVDVNNTTVHFATTYKRYWEDAQTTNNARESELSIYAACVPGYYLAASKPDDKTATGATVDGTTWTVGNSNVYSNTWDDSYSSTTIAWPIMRTGDDANVAKQTANFITSQDLCFSNNVANSGTDNRIIFDTNTNKFNSARLVFYHALTKVTFKIKKGEGFESTDAFAFSNADENIVLTGFNTSGTFDITQGEFLATPTIGTATINELAVESPINATDAAAGYVHVLHGLMLPGSALTSTATNEVYFTIDDNKYHITKAQLAAAIGSQKLSDGTTPALATGSIMLPGVHYIFTMTVGKQKVDKITASVVPWEEVTAAEMNPTNARIQISLLENGVALTKPYDNDEGDFDLYRTVYEHGSISDDYADYTKWVTGYNNTGNKAKLIWNASTSVYVAKDASSEKVWYWPNNKTFYHFRTVMPKAHAVTTEGTNGDYLTLTAAQNYTDVRWGAPFYDTTEKLVYTSANGFTYSDNSNYQISKAIGPTNGSINMVMFHMMSDVTIKLKTNDGGDDAVTIAGANINFSNTVTTGSVLMGNGKVVPGTTVSAVAKGNVTQIGTSTEYQWHYGFVPQSLENVVLTITTTDHNQYKINMKDVTVTSVVNNLIANPYTATSNKITEWYPNFKYTYTFNLTKTGVTQITATLANWENVEAGNDNVQIQ